jgi:hypothetical protein
MDNFYSNCPARMSDGRFLRDNRTSHKRELYNMYSNDINRSDDYRLFLQKNAEKIMDGEWCNMRNKQSCHNYKCFHNYPTRSSPPMLNEEMTIYNIGDTPETALKIKCENFNDYRASVTDGMDKHC